MFDKKEESEKKVRRATRDHLFIFTSNKILDSFATLFKRMSNVQLIFLVTR